MLKTRQKSKFRRLVYLLLAVLLVPGGWLLMQRMEGEKPRVDLEFSSPFLGASGQLKGELSDAGSGLRSVRVALSGGGKEVVLMEKRYPMAGITRGGAVRSVPLALSLEPKKDEKKD